MSGWRERCTTIDAYVLTVINPDGSQTIIDAVYSTVGVAGTGRVGDDLYPDRNRSDGGTVTIIDAGNTRRTDWDGGNGYKYRPLRPDPDRSRWVGLTIIDAVNSTVDVAGTGDELETAMC